jgi:hypothetical protein
VPEARKIADVVVVLAKVSSQTEVARIAREVPGIDIIINGNATSLGEVFTPPVYVGATLIVYTPYETRMLGELRFYRDSQGKFSTKQRFVTLDEILVPEDPGAKSIVSAAANAEAAARNNSKTLLEDWLASSRMLLAPKPLGSVSSKAESTTFVQSGACSQCHVAQYIKWSNSAHSHASDPLPPRANEFEASCLDCHATGPKPGSLTEKPQFTRFQNVQCEQCHGPGSAHVANPGKGYGRIGDMMSACVSCHNRETSPGFELQIAWEKIKH